VGVSTKSPAGAHIKHFSDLHIIMQIVGNAAVWRTAHATDTSYGDLQARLYGPGGHRVLAGLPISVRQVDEHRDVLASRDGRQRSIVGGFENKGDDVGRFFDAADHAILPRRLVGVNLGLLVQSRFLGDQLECEQPVDLPPSGGDLGCDGVAKHLTDGGKEVLPHDGVLLGADPKGDVLVGDSAQDVVERRRLGIDEMHGIGDHRAGQGFALFAGGLVALVENAQQLGMGGKHPGIEVSGDLVGMFGNDGRRCPNHAERRWRQQGWV
jgi:hypothetical protein